MAGLNVLFNLPTGADDRSSSDLNRKDANYSKETAGAAKFVNAMEK